MLFKVFKLPSLIFVFLITALFSSNSVSADFGENSFITIINPVRESPNTPDPGASLLAQYEQIKNFSYPATWLFTYDILRYREPIEVAKGMDEKQEFGVFLEVSPRLAKDTSVPFNLRDSWHRAASIFLSGYTQEDRIKLIDKVMKEFKSVFGYYPKTVGSWWTDSYSLSYLQEKYKVTVSLSVSDQFSLDEYTVWGTYWSLPYYPSKINAAIPAKNGQDKLDVVMLRWAARDPLNGFESPGTLKNSLYSVQDYSTAGLKTDYLEKLSSFYLNSRERDFGQLTLGLEGDFPPAVYQGEYRNNLAVVKALEGSGAKVVSAKDFGDWYRKSFKISPSSFLISDDLMGLNKRSIWFQSPFYRIGLVYDNVKRQLSIRDLRAYPGNFEEPFLKQVNRQNGLYIVLPSVIDSVAKPGSTLTFSCGNFISSEKIGEDYIVKFDNCQLKFNQKSVEIKGVEFPNFSDPQIKIIRSNDLTTIYPNQNWIVPAKGLTINALNIRIPYGLQRRFPGFILNYLNIFIVFASLLIAFALFVLIKHRWARRILAPFLILILLFLFLEFYQKLYVSQSEYDALMFLKSLPAGNVLVYDKDCSKCVYHSPFKPASMAGYKDYVGKIGQKKVVQSLMFSLAQSPDAIDSEIKKTNAKYIYFAKYEDYIEILAYPPETINKKLKKIFENANAQIWQII